MALEHEALTARIIGAAIEVHRRLGPGFLESVSEKALIIELKKRGIAVQDQMEVIITYDGNEVGRHRLDLFVEDTIVVDLKAIKNLEDIHFAVVRSQLRAVEMCIRDRCWATGLSTSEAWRLFNVVADR